MFVRKRATFYTFLLGALVGVPANHGGKLAAATQSTPQKNPLDQSFRLTIPLNTPRRYATRYNKDTRTLELRILPARLEEFKTLSYTNPKYIRLVTMKERLGEVFLRFELNNEPLGWMLGTQDDPWRLVLDVWKVRDDEAAENRGWSWLPEHIQGKQDTRPTYKDLQVPLSPLQTKKEKKEETPEHALAAHIGESKIPPEKFLMTHHFHILPEIFQAVESSVSAGKKELQKLKKELGETFGSKDEFTITKKLSSLLYRSGDYANAAKVFRRLLLLDDSVFHKNPEMLWEAGESEFLIDEKNTAADYFQTLSEFQEDNPLVAYAKLRLVDINELKNAPEKGFGKVSAKNAAIYRDMAFDEKLPKKVRMLAALRATYDHVEKDPDYVETFKPLLKHCAESKKLPFVFLKNCNYIVARLAAETDSIPEADRAVRYYTKLAPADNRNKDMDQLVTNRLKNLLNKTTTDKNYAAWLEVESKIRSSLLNFTVNNHDDLFTRADAFESVEDTKKALQLYRAFLKGTGDQKWKNEAMSRIALILYEKNLKNAANEYLARIRRDATRMEEGFTDGTVQNLKKLSIPPYKDKVAMDLLVDEIKKDRYTERDLLALTLWGKNLIGTPRAEIVFTKIREFPIKTSEETSIVENSILRYAARLRDAGQFAKAGENYLFVANLSGGSHIAEAAYKAGVVFARAGMFEKAKQAWILAANDTNDKRFSALANERLDRTEK